MRAPAGLPKVNIADALIAVVHAAAAERQVSAPPTARAKSSRKGLGQRGVPR
jgi:hypothetical protein